MFDIDKWQEIFDSIWRHKVRTALTAFGVFWGIFMLVVLMGAGKGLQHGVEHQLRDDANNSLWVYRGRTTMPYKGLPVGRRINFENKHYDMVEALPETEYNTGRFSIPGSSPLTRWGQRSSSFDIRCVHPGHKQIENTQMLEGRYINDTDLEEKRKIAVIGDLVVKELMDEGVEPIGQTIMIAGIAYKVVGVFTDSGSDRERQKIYLPVLTAQLAYNGGQRLNQIMSTIGDATLEEAQVIEKKIRKSLAEQLRFDPNDQRAIYIRNNVKEYQKFMGFFFAIKAFVWFVSIGTILAGVIGVSNIMLIIVKERTKEIGVRKALGATPFSITSMIVQEAIFITGLAGYLGLLLGVFVVYKMNQAIGTPSGGDGFFRNPELDFQIALWAIIVMVLAGALAGFFPAWRASKIQPIEALKD